ncbi:SLBB domain-containing protein [Leadbetterella sp. DM7]|uniref:SLBB domain-containing protein n=1 Tax=Leadbetterella sp. DM7 TaxID=3235085 RepID=UPI00349E5877
MNLSLEKAVTAQEKEKETKATTQKTAEPTQKNVPANNRTTTREGRLPAGVTTEARAIALTPEETVAVQAEETNRLAREAEIAADEARAAIIRRTFGSSLFANSKFDLTQAINIATPNNYVLGPGDELEVVVYGFSQNIQKARINADGYVVLEKSGVVSVANLDMDTATEKIKAALSKTYAGIKTGNTFVRVSLTGFRTIKVKVTGEVVAPGTYTLTSFSNLMAALHVSGGPNDIGTYRDIVLIRGNREIAHFDIYEFIVKGYASGDRLLQDQDVVQVGPFISRVAVSGFTKRTGLFEVKPGEKLSDLLKFAGGFNQYAYSDIVKIYRNTSSERRIVNVNKPDFPNENVYMGDSLVVEKVLDRIENVVTITGAVFRPGEYSLDSNPTLTKLVTSAAGLKEESLQGRININRTNNDLSISNISVNYNDILEGRAEDLKLKRLDEVIVPSIYELTEQSVIRIQGAINHEDAKEGIELPYVKDMTVQDVIVRVGGLTEAASLSRIEIVRRKRNIDPKQSDAQIAEIIQFNMRPDLSLVDSRESIYLLPFDEIIVRTSPNYEKQTLVKISGEVMFPGPYGLEYKDERISRLIERAGGLTDLAYMNGATLLRKTLLSERQRKKREETLTNLNIGNKIKTTEGLDVTTAPLTTTTTTTEGEVADSYINEDIPIDLKKILANPNDITYDLILQDGDEIVIPKRLETVRIEGEILYPTTVKYNSGKSFLDYISASGGFTKKSAKGSAYVRYPNGNVDRTRKFMFMRFHPKVEPGSEIVIPPKTETTTEQFNKLSGTITTISATLGTIVTIIGLIRLTK